MLPKDKEESKIAVKSLYTIRLFKLFILIVISLVKLLKLSFIFS